MSIYRVSEASNESPDKLSAKKHKLGFADRTEQVIRDQSIMSRGRVSASFYLHANRLSAWKSNVLEMDVNGGGFADNVESFVTNNEGHEANEITLKIPRN